MNDTLELNKLAVKNFDRVVGYVGRGRTPMVDWVTESTYLSEKSLTKDQFNTIVKEHHQICGSLKYKNTNKYTLLVKYYINMLLKR